jgi:nicotinamidase-related amidase
MLQGEAGRCHAVALLLVDVINDFDFPEAEQLIAHAASTAEPIERLLVRARRGGVPVIYVNDNFGHWRSDFRATIARCSEPSRPGAALVRRLLPQLDDYFVLKPKHSGFFHTPLELLLAQLGSKAVIICGFATNSCVTFTAHDAHMRGLRVAVPNDTTAANTDVLCRSALQNLEVTLHADVGPSAALDLEALARPREAQKSQ